MNRGLLRLVNNPDIYIQYITDAKMGGAHVAEENLLALHLLLIFPHAVTEMTDL